MKKFVSAAVAASAIFVFGTVSQAADTLHVKKLAAAPTVDGVAEDVWKGIPALTVKVDRVPEAIVQINKEKQKGKYAKHWSSTDYTTVSEVELKAAYTGDSIFFLARWKDATKDDQHKPWKWEGTKDAGEYKAGKEAEDRLAMHFPIKGDFVTCMVDPADSTSDVWQWKAARTNGAGIIHDKTDVYSKSEPKGAFSTHYAVDGTTVYLLRPDDGGVAPYKTNKIDPFVYQGDVVPQYVPFVPDNPDAADVKAKGVWADGYWTLEIGRKLDTGHPDTDTVFDVAKGFEMALAAFDHASDHFHAGSGLIKAVFDK